MRCVSPATFVTESNLASEALDVLVVDAEGMDAEIVMEFLKISQPCLVVY